MFSLIFFARCLLALLFLDASNAVPLLVNRQATNTNAPLSKPTTVMSVSTSMTPAGPLTQTCVITLTPVKDSNGQPAVEEVKNCTVAMNANNNSNSTSSSLSSSSGSSGSSASSSSSGSSSSSSDSGSSSTSTSAPAASSNSAISVDGTSTVTSSTQTASGASSGSTTAASSSSAGSSSDTSGSGSSSSASATTTANGSSSSGTTTANSSSSDSATAAADNSNPSASVSAAASNQSNQQLAEQTYVVPGKSLQVLPIGLGVFAGISALALIVVGLVTYERTKYRKAFRQRKLAEQGAAMGYSR